jgi:CrcB protein
MLGCLLIGLFYGLTENSLSPNLRLFLTVGFCGGFTTFSTFANESLQLFKTGNIWLFSLYAALSVFFGILAVYAGNLLSRIF